MVVAIVVVMVIVWRAEAREGGGGGGGSLESCHDDGMIVQRWNGADCNGKSFFESVAVNISEGNCKVNKEKRMSERATCSPDSGWITSSFSGLSCGDYNDEIMRSTVRTAYCVNVLNGPPSYPKSYVYYCSKKEARKGNFTRAIRHPLPGLPMPDFTHITPCNFSSLDPETDCSDKSRPLVQQWVYNNETNCEEGEEAMTGLLAPQFNICYSTGNGTFQRHSQMYCEDEWITIKTTTDACSEESFVSSISYRKHFCASDPRNPFMNQVYSCDFVASGPSTPDWEPEVEEPIDMEPQFEPSEPQPQQPLSSSSSFPPSLLFAFLSASILFFL